jgi:hypothetical protein
MVDELPKDLAAEGRVFPGEKQEGMPDLIDLRTGHAQAAVAKTHQCHVTLELGYSRGNPLGRQGALAREPFLDEP